MDTMAKEKVEIGDLVALERSLRELPILLYNMEVCKTNLELINKVFEILNREDCDKILEEMSRESLKILTGSMVSKDSSNFRKSAEEPRISDNFINLCSLITDKPSRFLLAKVDLNGGSIGSKLVKEDAFSNLKNRIREFYQDLSDLAEKLPDNGVCEKEADAEESNEEEETGENEEETGENEEETEENEEENFGEQEKEKESGEEGKTDTEGEETAESKTPDAKTPAKLSKKCTTLSNELFNYYRHESRRDEIIFLFFKSMIKRNNQPIDEASWTEMVAEMESIRKKDVSLSFSGKRGIVNLTILSKFAKDCGMAPYKEKLQTQFGDICKLKSGKLSLTPTWGKSIASMLKDL
jgi:uncharacterized protein with von Willebrand factor type A (vWA) domain